MKPPPTTPLGRRLSTPILLLFSHVTLAVLADEIPATSHTAPQAPPILLGTSGGNIQDISALYCCSGTLGALVEDAAGTRFILSNNHVLARANQGSAGEPVSQPGLIDYACGTYQVVANLSGFVPIQFGKGRKLPNNTADAAIAEVVGSSVAEFGDIIDIGPVSAQTVAASVGQQVQKSGRTTGLTWGTVELVNATVNVAYSMSCGGAANQVARFVNQLVIADGSFSAGGDSGSLIVERGSAGSDGLPRAVGLLFAGSSTHTIANPIDSVLSELGVFMLGGAPAVSEASVQCITYNTSGPGGRDLVITVSVVGTGGQALPGASVTVAVTRGSSLYADATATTDSAGNARFSFRRAPDGVYSTDVTSVDLTGYTFDGSEPLNTFAKGTTPVPADFCASGASGAVRQGAEVRPPGLVGLDRAREVQAAHGETLLSLEDVVGHALGRDAHGEPVVKVLLDKDNQTSRQRIPRTLDGVPVEVVVTGPLVAY